MKKFNVKKTLALALSFSSLLMACACEDSATSVPNKTGFTSDAVLFEEGMTYETTTKGTPKAYASLTYDFLGGDEVMPIGGFYGPYASGGTLDGNARGDLLTDEVFAALRDAGINMFVYNKDIWLGEDGGTTVNKCLDLCQKYGIGYYVMLQYVETQLGGKTTPYPTDKMELQTDAGVAKLQRILDNLTKNGERTCVLGLHAKDEPFMHEVKNLSVLQDVFYNKLPNNYGLDLYGNTLGHWHGEYNFFGTYEYTPWDTYIDYYFEQAKPKMLSATQYPFTSASTAEATLTRSLFEQLAIYTEVAKEQNIPFWRMMQAGGQWNDASAWIDSVTPYQSEAELLFDVNVALAYGAKAIQYFTLVQPLHFAYATGGTYDYERNGLIGANGNLTRWYYYAQRANKQVQAVDEYLMKSANERVLVHGKKATEIVIENAKDEETGKRVAGEGWVTADKSYKELSGIEGDDCIVGCFDYKGGTALYVTNYSRLTKGEVLLKFNKKYKYKVIQRASEVDVVGTSIPLTLDAGEGALIVLE